MTVTPAVSTYSTTPANNVQANTGINWDEGMAPAAVNNSARQNMSDLRGYANNPEWFFYGSGTSPVVTPVYVSPTSFKVAGVDVSSVYHINRRIRAVGSGTGTIYGTISAVAFSTDTTVTVIWDSGSLTNETLTISIGPAVANYPVGNMKAATRQVLTSGSSATYTTPAGARLLRIRMIAGGGGGGANSGTGTNGSTGATTSFNSVTVIGGSGGQSNGSGGAGGTGGTGSPTGILRIAGSSGAQGTNVAATVITAAPGASGGGGLFGGGGGTGAGAANSGAGGQGGTASSIGAGNAGGGGGAGEYAEFIINSPAATYTYTVGGGGGVASGISGGGAGGSGVIIVEEHY